MKKRPGRIVKAKVRMRGQLQEEIEVRAFVPSFTSSGIPSLDELRQTVPKA